MKKSERVKKLEMNKEEVRDNREETQRLEGKS